jgi:ABC-type nitrate/sulfonate/bicarbonate transport system substrate-binding protein
MSSRSGLAVLRRKEPLRVGFLPVSDCAPLVYAHEAGLFAKYDLDVQLQRETGWANVRDKVVQGDLDAAHAPATLPFLANLGLDSDPCACVSGLVLSLQGNTIILSRRLSEEGVQDPLSFREHIYKTWGKRSYTFGVVFSFSPQELLLRKWLKSGNIAPETEVRIVAVPPSQMYPTLKLGYLDGFCVGEPWASMAEQAGVGVRVATSWQLAPLHPEKVLIVRQSFALGRSSEHERLLAALIEACAFCDRPQNRPMLSDMLAHPQYVNAPLDCVEAGWMYDATRGEPPAGTSVFHRHDANNPSDEKARWIMDGLYETLNSEVFKARHPGRAPVLINVFRRDIFEEANSIFGDHMKQQKIEGLKYRGPAAAGNAAKVIGST